MISALTWFTFQQLRGREYLQPWKLKLRADPEIPDIPGNVCRGRSVDCQLDDVVCRLRQEAGVQSLHGVSG
jgi:hypothetical protein